MDLIDMIKVESITKIKEIIDSKGIPIDSSWLDYESLNAALQFKRADVAMLLLEKNCRVNKSNKTDVIKADSPLHHAVVLGDLDIVQHLLNKKASIVAADSKGNTPLHLAFMLKREMIVDLLLTLIDKTSTYANSTNDQGLTHFHIACTRKNESIIKRFLKAGADVEGTVDRKSLSWAGFNALHFAANAKSLEAVRTLVTKSNIDMTSENGNGQTPFRLAYDQFEDTLVMLDFLSKDATNYVSHNREYSQFSFFHMACMLNDPKDVKSFISKGAGVNTPINCDAYRYPWYTPLFFAMENIWIGNIKVLLEKGSNVSSLSNEGMTPLHLAFYTKSLCEREQIINQIYSQFDKNMISADENGLNLLHIACSRNDIDTVSKILDSGKNVNKIVSYKKRDFYRFTPLHFAVKYGHIEMAELLIKRGADVNANNGWAHGTPLHLASDAGHKKLIELLIDSGANQKAKRVCDKQTMLHIIAHKSHDDADLLVHVEHLLEKFDLDVNAADNEGKTPLHHACCLSGKSVKWIELLLKYGADINLKCHDDKVPFQQSNLPNRWLLSFYDKAKKTFYHHVQKLKAVGVPVDSRNEKFCEELMKRVDCNECFKDETLARMEQQRQDEIDKMKRIKLDEKTSLHQFVVMKPNLVGGYADNWVLQNIVDDPNCEKQYPCYGYLIRLQYERAKSSKNGKGRKKRAGRDTDGEAPPSKRQAK